MSDAVHDGARQRPEDDDVRGGDHEQAREDGPLAESRGFVLQLVQPRAALDEARDRPAGEAEQPQFLAGGWIHGQVERVVGVALRAADFFGVAILPDSALAKEPVRRQPRAPQDDRRPPREAGKNSGEREAAEGAHEAAGDEVERDVEGRTGHREVEVAGDREVAGQPLILEMAHPRRADAGVGQLVIQPRRSAVAEVVADGKVHRRQHLLHDEQRADEPEQVAEGRPALNARHQPSHRHGKHGRQHTTQDEEHPPRRSQADVGLRQHAEELPLIPLGESSQHARHSPPSGGVAVVRIWRQRASALLRI
jgi:hypothetical protein